MRPYTGATDRRKSTRPGTKAFQDYLCFLFGAKNLGLYADRPTRNGAGLSVHATGRAGDTGGNESQVRAILAFLDNKCRDLLEEIHDYRNLFKTSPKKLGAAWRCDRDAWRIYDKSPSPIGAGGLWVHWELAPTYADNPDLIHAHFQQIFKP